MLVERRLDICMVPRNRQSNERFEQTADQCAS